jgi:hypothetical protein
MVFEKNFTVSIVWIVFLLFIIIFWFLRDKNNNNINNINNKNDPFQSLKNRIIGDDYRLSEKVPPGLFMNLITFRQKYDRYDRNDGMDTLEKILSVPENKEWIDDVEVENILNLIMHQLDSNKLQPEEVELSLSILSILAIEYGSTTILDLFLKLQQDAPKEVPDTEESMEKDYFRLVWFGLLLQAYQNNKNQEMNQGMNHGAKLKFHKIVKLELFKIMNFIQHNDDLPKMIPPQLQPLRYDYVNQMFYCLLLLLESYPDILSISIKGIKRETLATNLYQLLFSNIYFLKSYIPKDNIILITDILIQKANEDPEIGKEILQVNSMIRKQHKKKSKSKKKKQQEENKENKEKIENIFREYYY